MKSLAAKELEIKLVRSVIGTPRWMRSIVQSLGLRRLNSVARHKDNGAIRGMVHRVQHLVQLREVESGK